MGFMITLEFIGEKMINEIEIFDWAGNTLFKGDYQDKEVDEVLDANRCTCPDGCHDCDNTGYMGDFSVKWCDDSDDRNVYEYINY